MAEALTMNATEFKAKCLQILDRLSTGQLESVVVTKRGKPVGVLMPPPNESARDVYGFMRGTVFIPPDVDLTDPVFDGASSADDGILHG